MGRSPKSGEIIGMLKQLPDKMQASLEDGTDAEAAKIIEFKRPLAMKLHVVNVFPRLIWETERQPSKLEAKSSAPRRRRHGGKK